MTRHVVGAVLVLAIAGGGCAGRAAVRGQGPSASQGYELVHPPDVADTRYPGGVHVVADAPLTRWHRVAVFATREDCEAARIKRIDDSIDEARMVAGDRAKYQLPVRLAVNARCAGAQ